MKRRRHLSFMCISLGVVVGCSKPSDDFYEVRIEHTQDDIFELNGGVQLPDRPLSLEDLLGFALNRNLDLLGLQHEYEIQREVATGEKLAMLPSLTANAEVSQRSHEAGSTSKSFDTGTESTSASLSSDRVANRRDLSFLWNLVDFGLSYYRARQEESRILIVQERYKRLRQNLILDVLQSYWKSVIAKKAVDGAESIVKLAESRQENLKRQIERQTISEISGLENEQRLIEMQIRLQTFQSDYHRSKAELASLLGLTPGTEFTLLEPEIAPHEPVELDIEELEIIALENRPELFIQDLEGKVAADEVKSSMVRMLPNASLFGNYNYDRNHFLVNNNWSVMGARAAWNLLALPRFLQGKNISERRLIMEEKSRLSLSVGILTQVHLSYLSYLTSIKQSKLSNDLYSVKQRLLNAVRKGEQLGEYGGEEILRLEAEALFAQINSLTSYAEMQISLERINNSLGRSLYFHNLDFDRVEASRLGIEEEVFEEGVVEDRIVIDEDLPLAAAAEKPRKKSDVEVPFREKEEPKEKFEVSSSEAVMRRRWLRGYSSDEEYEQVFVGEGGHTADEEWDHYSKLLDEGRIRKRDFLPEEEKKKREEKKKDFVFHSVEESRSVEKMLEDLESGQTGEGDVDAFIKSVMEELPPSEPSLLQTRYVTLVKKIDEKEEILAYLGEDDADEWMSDKTLAEKKKSLERSRQLSSEEILSILGDEEMHSDEELSFEEEEESYRQKRLLLQRLIEENPPPSGDEKLPEEKGSQASEEPSKRDFASSFASGINGLIKEAFGWGGRKPKEVEQPKFSDKDYQQYISRLLQEAREQQLLRDGEEVEKEEVEEAVSQFIEKESVVTPVEELFLEKDLIYQEPLNSLSEDVSEEKEEFDLEREKTLSHRSERGFEGRVTRQAASGEAKKGEPFSEEIADSIIANVFQWVRAVSREEERFVDRMESVTLYKKVEEGSSKEEAIEVEESIVEEDLLQPFFEGSEERFEQRIPRFSDKPYVLDKRIMLSPKEIAKKKAKRELLSEKRFEERVSEVSSGVFSEVRERPIYEETKGESSEAIEESIQRGENRVRSFSHVKESPIQKKVKSARVFSRVEESFYPEDMGSNKVYSHLKESPIQVRVEASREAAFEERGVNVRNDVDMTMFYEESISHFSVEEEKEKSVDKSREERFERRVPYILEEEELLRKRGDMADEWFRREQERKDLEREREE